jgi:hypothetical protein
MLMEAMDEFVTPDEAAILLDVGREQIDNMVEEELLQPVSIDTETWLYRAEVEALRLQGG